MSTGEADPVALHRPRPGRRGRRGRRGRARSALPWSALPWSAGLLVAGLQLVSIAYLSSLGGLMWWSHAPRLVGWQPKVVLTGSMMPVIRPGDIALVGPADPHERVLPPGRIVLVRDPGRESGSYLHRVVRYEENGFLVTKGDANQSEDNPSVDPDRVLGQVRMLVPAVGRPLVWLHDQKYVALGIALALTWAAMALALNARGDGDDESAGGSDGRSDGRSDGGSDGGSDGRSGGASDGERDGDQAVRDAAAARAADPVPGGGTLADEVFGGPALSGPALSGPALSGPEQPDLVLPEPLLPMLGLAAPADDVPVPAGEVEVPAAARTLPVSLSPEAERLALDLDAFEAAFGSAFGADEGEDVSDFDGRGFDR